MKVADFGIRGVHLVYELLDGCDLFVLVDAAQRGCSRAPSRCSRSSRRRTCRRPNRAVMDAHGLAPDEVFAMLASLGGRPGRSLVVACEPADTSPGMGLSDAGTGALPRAVRAVEEILDEITAERRSGRWCQAR